MTKIKVDENGLSAREQNPFGENQPSSDWTRGDAAVMADAEEQREIVNMKTQYYGWINFEKTVKSYPLTEPAEPNLVCDGDQIPMYSYDGEKWERCVIDTVEYICPTGAETKTFWQIVKPMQESKEESKLIGNPDINNPIDENTPMLTKGLIGKIKLKITIEGDYVSKLYIAQIIKTGLGRFPQFENIPIIDEYVGQSALSELTNLILIKDGATHQTPITKAETIEDVVRVIEEYRSKADGYVYRVDDLLSQIKNI